MSMDNAERRGLVAPYEHPFGPAQKQACPKGHHYCETPARSPGPTGASPPSMQPRKGCRATPQICTLLLAGAELLIIRGPASLTGGCPAPGEPLERLVARHWPALTPNTSTTTMALDLIPPMPGRSRKIKLRH